MKVESNLLIELNRSSDGQFLNGFFVMNGIRQKINVVPKGVDFEELMKFLSLHAIAATATGKHGSLAYKKGKGGLVGA